MLSATNDWTHRSLWAAVAETTALMNAMTTVTMGIAMMAMMLPSA